MNRTFHSLLIGGSLAFVLGCSGLSSPSMICHDHGIRSEANATHVESVTLQGLDVPTKTVAIGPLGLSLSEAMIAWQLPPWLSYSDVNLTAKTTAASDQMRAASIELVLQELKQWNESTSRSQPSLAAINDLANNLQKGLTAPELQGFGNHASKGLIGFLEAERPTITELRTVLEGLTIGAPQLQQKAISALDAKRFEELAGLIQQLANASPLHVALRPYIGMDAAGLASAIDERDRFAKMLLRVNGGEQLKNKLDDHYRIYERTMTDNRAIAELDASRLRLTSELSQMMEKEGFDSEWIATGLAQQSVVDASFRNALATDLTTKLSEPSATGNSMNRNDQRYLATSPRDEYCVMVCKADGTQSILSMGAAMHSYMGGIQLCDRDRVVLVRWDNAAFGNVDERYTYADVQSKTEQFRQDWHNVVVVGTTLMGRETQIYLPMGSRIEGCIPKHPFIPSDATFTYGHCQALPIMVRGELQRRTKRSTAGAISTAGQERKRPLPSHSSNRKLFAGLF